MTRPAPTPAKADETTDLREALAAWLLGRDDALAADEIDHYAAQCARHLPTWLYAPHSGDCTKESHSCIRCIAERVYEDADAAIAGPLAQREATHAAEIQALRADSASMSSLVRQATAEIMRVELERDGCASLAGSALAENMIVRFLNDRLAAENAKFARWLGFTDGMDPAIRSASEASREMHAVFLEQQRARTQAHCAALPEAITPKETSDVQN